MAIYFALDFSVSKYLSKEIFTNKGASILLALIKLNLYWYIKLLLASAVILINLFSTVCLVARAIGVRPLSARSVGGDQ